MLEDLRDDVLTLLEERVERAIGTINSLRAEKLALESENNQLRNDLDQRDVQIQNLEQRNAELNHFETEITVLRAEREQERLEIDKEKAEVRERLEGLMTMLNNVENRSEGQVESEPAVLDDASEVSDNMKESQVESEPTIFAYTSETADNTEEGETEAATPVLDDTSETVNNTEEQQEEEQEITPEDILFIPTRLVEPEETERPSDSDGTTEETDAGADRETEKDTDEETELA